MVSWEWCNTELESEGAELAGTTQPLFILCFQHGQGAELGAKDTMMDKASTLLLMVYKPMEEQARKWAVFLPGLELNTGFGENMFFTYIPDKSRVWGTYLVVVNSYPSVGLPKEKGQT